MPAFLHEWLNVVLRWAHVTAAIMWVGDSFLFMWMDSTLDPPGPGRSGDVVGELWMTHSGGFYEVVKHRTLGEVPPRLWWFKWQSYTTWITGMLLLTVVYALGGRAMLLDAASPLGHGAAVALVFAVLAAGVALYEVLCRIPGLRGLALGAVALPLLAGAAWGLEHVFTARATFLLVGATVGTIMAANVFFVIIPSQRKLVEAKEQGIAPDPVYGLRGKQRSVHNNYFTLPVLFIMISNHYPMTYGSKHGWLILIAIMLLAAYVRHFFNLRHRGRTVWAIPVTAALATLALAIAIAPDKPQAAAGGPPSFAKVQAIVTQRCATCHADKPTQEGFAVAPKDVKLHTPELIVANAQKIYEQAVVTKAMPIANLTGMTDDERASVAAWVAAGAPAR